MNDEWRNEEHREIGAVSSAPSLIDGTGLDHSFRVVVEDADAGRFLRAAVRHLPPDGCDPQQVIELNRSGVDEWSVQADGRTRFIGSLTPALARLMSLINVGAVRSAGDNVVAHAGAVSRGGAAVLLPGAPGAGKSTTVAALLLRGFDYLSDEAAPIDETGSVRPFPKPVVVGRGSWPSLAGSALAAIPFEGAELDARWLDPGLFDGAVMVASQPIAAIVLPTYVPSSPLFVEHLSPAAATTLVASNLFNLEAHGASGVRAIAAVAREVPRLRAEFGDVRELCDLVDTLV